MKERPILFNGAMVRAILSGAKTQTRRNVKPQPSFLGAMDDPTQPFVTRAPGLHVPILCPFGQPGDRLWVRERAAFYWGGWHYFADGASEWGPDVSPRTFSRPSIHMPREACRLVLEITDVRVERLQTISEADAIAEGLTQTDSGSWLPGPCDHPEWAFHQLWDQVYGESAWDSDPWVWVIEFKRLEVAGG